MLREGGGGVRADILPRSSRNLNPVLFYIDNLAWLSLNATVIP